MSFLRGKIEVPPNRFAPANFSRWCQITRIPEICASIRFFFSLRNKSHSYKRLHGNFKDPFPMASKPLLLSVSFQVPSAVRNNKILPPQDRPMRLSSFKALFFPSRRIHTQHRRSAGPLVSTAPLLSLFTLGCHSESSTTCPQLPEKAQFV